MSREHRRAKTDRLDLGLLKRAGGRRPRAKEKPCGSAGLAVASQGRERSEVTVSRFRPWPWCRSCRMGPSFGALPPMRMTASGSGSRRDPPNTRLRRGNRALLAGSPPIVPRFDDRLRHRDARQMPLDSESPIQAPYKGGKAQRIPPIFRGDENPPQRGRCNGALSGRSAAGASGRRGLAECAALFRPTLTGVRNLGHASASRASRFFSVASGMR